MTTTKPETVVGEVVEAGQALQVHAGAPTPPARSEPATSPNAIIELLHFAVERGVPIEMMERLQLMHERVSDRAAAAEFAQALATFQGKCPPIAKTSVGKVEGTTSGAKFQYKYAELDEISRTVNPILREVGLSYSWDSSLDGATLKCVCTLRHINGHKETASFVCPTTSRAGMSDQQKVASALTYARRQSLVQILGLTTCDPDTDGAHSTEKITAEQADDLQALIQENGKSVGKFLKWAGVEKLSDVRAADYESALNVAKAKAAPAGSKPAVERGDAAE